MRGGEGGAGTPRGAHPKCNKAFHPRLELSLVGERSLNEVESLADSLIGRVAAELLPRL